jgi:hypothetical protein
MSDEDYKGVTVGKYSIAFSQVHYIEVEKDGSLSVFFNGRFLMFNGQDAENFYRAYRAYLGIFPEADEDEELPF